LNDKIGTIDEVFDKYITPILIDLDTGEYDLEGASDFDLEIALKEDALALNKDQDIAAINKRANQSDAYLIKDDNQEIISVVLPVYGQGLWSTMYAFVNLGKDANTINSIKYYQQEETPGLGGEVQNPVWRDKWQGKKIYDDNGDIAIKVVKGSASDIIYEIDGLSGATLTSDGVENTMSFWFGELGFAKFLQKFKQGEVNNV